MPELKRQLLVGFDLCDDFSQISCFNTKLFEPESICFKDDQSRYLIPTVLGVHNNTKEWYFGDEAIEMAKRQEGVLIENILKSIIDNKPINIYNSTFTGVQILQKFFKKSFTLLKGYYPSEAIKKIVVTIRKVEPNLINTIYMALKNIGIEKDRVLVQSHEQSYIYYALSQKRDLWMNDVGLFELDEEGLKYYQIIIDRKMQPFIAIVYDKDFKDILTYSMVKNRDYKEDIEYIFENIAQKALYKQIVSTLYMTGKGFEGNWASEVLKKLCVGRRVFKGLNLYTKGACYAARELELEGAGKFKEFKFISDEIVTYDVMLKVYSDAAINHLSFAKAATAWYEIDHSFEVILDNENEIEIIFKHIMRKEAFSHVIILDGLAKRENKMTRVSIRVRFLDALTCVISVKDLGFGEFAMTTNRIWERVISLKEG